MAAAVDLAESHGTVPGEVHNLAGDRPIDVEHTEGHDGQGGEVAGDESVDDPLRHEARHPSGAKPPLPVVGADPPFAGWWWVTESAAYRPNGMMTNSRGGMKIHGGRRRRIPCDRDHTELRVEAQCD